MMSQNLDAVSENSPNGFCPLISFTGYKCKGEGDVFCCRRTFVVRQSFEEIDSETAEKECLKKELDVYIMVLWSVESQ